MSYECLLVLYKYKTFFERHTKLLIYLYIFVQSLFLAISGKILKPPSVLEIDDFLPIFQ